ncbi:MAG: hypothetical protein U0792_23060 [Gemmataceae bacterium]
MKWGILAVASAVVLISDAAPAHAQFIGGPVYRSSFGYGGGVGFSYHRHGFSAAGFGGFYSRSVFTPFGYGFNQFYGGVCPGFSAGCSPFFGGLYPYAPVLPWISRITPFGFSPGFLGPGWGVGPMAGWNPVWGGALGAPWTAPWLGGLYPPLFSPFGQAYLNRRWAGSGTTILQNPNDLGNGVANAGGVPPAAAAPAPVIGAGNFLVIEPKRRFPAARWHRSRRGPRSGTSCARTAGVQVRPVRPKGDCEGRGRGTGPCEGIGPPAENRACIRGRGVRRPSTGSIRQSRRIPKRQHHFRKRGNQFTPSGITPRP